MSQATQNAAEVVRAGYAVLNAADLEALDRIFASDASWHTPGRSAIAGVREGKDAVFQQFGRYGPRDRPSKPGPSLGPPTPGSSRHAPAHSHQLRAGAPRARGSGRPIRRPAGCPRSRS